MDAFLVLETLSLVNTLLRAGTWFSIYSSFKIKSFLIPGAFSYCEPGMLCVY